MKATADGAAILGAMTAIPAAASAAVMEQADQTMIATASTGSVGAGTLTIKAGATGDIPNGTRFRTAAGVELVLPVGVHVSSGSAAVTLGLQTLRMLDLANTDANAFDDALDAGEVLTGIMPTENVAGSDWLRAGTYVSSTPILGAKMDWLSAHGDERGCHRQPREDGEAYRMRVRAIPDAVTPSAIFQSASGAASQSGLGKIYIVEPYPDQATALSRAARNLVWADSVFCDSDFCDDPYGEVLDGKEPFQALEVVSLRTGRAYFRLALKSPLTEPDGSVLYADDGFCDDDVWGYPDVGLHPTMISSLSVVAESVRTKKAGGVNADFFIETATILKGEATTPGSAAQEVAWTITAPSGSAYFVNSGLASANAVTRPTLGTESYGVRFTFSPLLSATIWGSSPWSIPMRRSDLERYGICQRLVTKIEGLTNTQTPTPINLWGTFWTTAFTL
jgi:hypothetical protein